MPTPHRFLAPLALTLLLHAATARGQDVEITPYAGYEGGGSFGVLSDLFPNDRAAVEGDATFGVGVGIRLGPGYLLKFVYGRQETALVEKGGLFGEQEPIFDLSVSHFHGGLEWEFGEDDVFRPFLEGLIGASRFAPEEDERSSEWFFSGGVGGGVKLFFSEHVGLQLKARYIPVVVRSSEDLFCGPGGCFVAFDQEYVSRGEASAGVTFRF